MRNPELAAILAQRSPAASHEATWARPMRLRSYVGAVDLPDELVLSIRVFVLVGDDVVVCTNADGKRHAWPGGRREPGESHVETACREVREETGWLLDPTSLEPLGFLHIENLGEPNPPYPHPDILQVVYTGRAAARAADEWTDTEGYEVSSRLAPLVDAGGFEDELCDPFLEILRARA